jgi:hypothetical protein
VVCFTKTRQSQVCAYPPSVGRSSRVAIRPQSYWRGGKLHFPATMPAHYDYKSMYGGLARAVPDLGRLADADVKNVVE